MLSHDNGSVDSGLIVNGDMLVKNLHETSLVAFRMVFDSVNNAGGHVEVAIDKLML